MLIYYISIQLLDPRKFYLTRSLLKKKQKWQHGKVKSNKYINQKDRFLLGNATGQEPKAILSNTSLTLEFVVWILSKGKKWHQSQNYTHYWRS